MIDPQPGPVKVPAIPADQQTIIEVRGHQGGVDDSPDPSTPKDGAYAEQPALDAASLPVQRLDDYEILEEIGRGGMGIVFRARQLKLNRIVALKMILGGALARAEDLQRFNTEAAAAAQLHHPGIVALFEAGAFDNQPYFSMEYVEGSSLGQLVARGPLPGRRAAAYLEKTARAVQYAHKRGIIHRDLKPANVLVDEHDQPKITDFGLAKVIQTDSGQTRTGTVIGTPSYMSPEQAAASKDLGPASDIYSLGAILYELITGLPPFRGETALATLTKVVEDDPARPRSLVRTIDVDLETICLKCLAKEPARRYASAEALADDLQRYLDGEPIAARPLGRLERALVWCRRKPAQAALLAVSAAALLALVCGAFAFAVMQGEAATEERQLRGEAERQKTAAEAARRLAQERLGTMSWLYYLAEMRQVQEALDAANLDRAERLLKSWPRPDQLDPRDWEWYYLWNLAHGRFTLAGHTGRATALAWHPDGWHLASAGGPPAKAADVKIWDTRTGKLLHTLTGHTNKIGSVAYSADGRLLATASEDGSARLWDPHTGKSLAILPHNGARATVVAFHPAGKHLATADGTGKIRVWLLDGLGAADWQPVPLVWSAHAGEIGCLAFSPEENGHWLASGGQDTKVKLWDALRATELAVLPPSRGEGDTRAVRGHQGPVKGLAFSHDGKLLASAGGLGARAGEVLVWDLAAGEERFAFTGLNDRMISVSFNKLGYLAAGCNDGTLRIWSKPRPEAQFVGEPLRIRADAQGIYALAYSGNGQHLATAGLDGRIRLWNNNGGQETLTLPAYRNSEAVAFSKDGRWLAAAVGERGRPGKVALWASNEAELSGPTLEHPAAVRSLAWHPQGKLIATGSEDHEVRLFDLESSNPTATLLKAQGKGHTRTVTMVAFSPDGKFLASSSDDETIILWNIEKRTVERELLGHTDGVEAVAFSPDGKMLASVGADRKVLLWSLATGQFVVLGEIKSWTHAVAFSPDGKLVATGSDDKVVRLWDVSTRTESRKLEGSAGGVLTVAFHPDGRRLVSAGADKVVRLWDLVTGQEILELEGSTGEIKSVAFSKDGRWLAAGGYHSVIRLWEAPRQH